MNTTQYNDRERNNGHGRGRAICFIDNSNIFKGQQAAGWRIDWQKFITHLETSGSLWQTWFFASEQSPPREEQQRFYDFLRGTLRWEVKLYDLGQKHIECQQCGNHWTYHVEKGVDVGVASQMLILAHNRAFDTAILVSGDRDYVETLQFIKSLGLRVEIVSWRGGTSAELARQSSAPVLYLDDVRQHIERSIQYQSDGFTP